MNYSLALLALQALPLLGKKIPPFERLYGYSYERFIDAMHEAERVVEEERISWRDIYEASDIGRERLAIARRLDLRSDERILEVGCGRGYFTIAAAPCCRVLALDSMDKRPGLWGMFLDTMEKIGIAPADAVCADAGVMPFRDETFDRLVFVHSTRNFSGVEDVERAFREAHRVLKKDGSCFIIESAPRAENIRQRNYLDLYDFFRHHVCGEAGLLEEEVIAGMLGRASFRSIRSETQSLGFQATPPLFDARIFEDEGLSSILSSIEEHGIQDSPLLVLEAKP